MGERIPAWPSVTVTGLPRAWQRILGGGRIRRMESRALKTNSMDDFDLRMSEESRPFFEAVVEFLGNGR